MLHSGVDRYIINIINTTVVVLNIDIDMFTYKLVQMMIFYNFPVISFNYCTINDTTAGVEE